jgi:iron(III) transport system ATP-binding protein
MVGLQDIRKHFDTRRGAVRALDGVSLAVGAGTFYTLLGPSGCGKTTLLRCIAGLEQPDAGEIRLGDRVVWSRAARINVPPYERALGMVFQSYAIWPHMTVFENVAFPLVNLRPRPPADEIRRRTLDVLEMVGLAAMVDRSATLLSGGQQQRVALARAVVARPDTLLLDEPLSNLDANLREQMRSEILGLQRRLGTTAVYVTHDQGEALAMSDRIAVLKDGHVVQEGTPQEIYGSPRTAFVAEFVGGANVLHGTWNAGRLECAMGALVCPGGGAAGSRGALAIRPEQIRLSAGHPDADVNAFAAEVSAVQYLGSLKLYELRVGSQNLRACGPAALPLGTGERAFVQVPPEACCVVQGER